MSWLIDCTVKQLRVILLLRLGLDSSVLTTNYLTSLESWPNRPIQKLNFIKSNRILQIKVPQKLNKSSPRILHFFDVGCQNPWFLVRFWSNFQAFGQIFRLWSYFPIFDQKFVFLAKLWSSIVKTWQPTSKNLTKRRKIWSKSDQKSRKLIKVLPKIEKIDQKSEILIKIWPKIEKIDQILTKNRENWSKIGNFDQKSSILTADVVKKVGERLVVK